MVSCIANGKSCIYEKSSLRTNVFSILGEIYGLYECEICVLSFESELERDEHTKSHFRRIRCEKCDKILIKIANEWYELHSIWNCNDKENHTESKVSESTVRKKKIEYVNTDYIGESTYHNTGYVSEIYQETENEVDYELQASQNDHTKLEETTCITTGYSSFTVHEIENFSPSNCEIARTEQPGSSVSIKIELRPECLYPTDILDEVDEGSESIDPSSGKADTLLECESVCSTVNRTIKRENVAEKLPEDWTCPTCDKKLKTRSSLISHVRIIHENKKVQRERATCDVCEQTFSSVGNMKKHRESHLEEKRFVCSYCGRGFNGLFNLKEHTNSHTGVKPYTCEICGKSFGRQTNKYSHMRIHSGEKPYKCNIDNCERAYAFKIDLNRHRYSTHGIYTKKHICPICSKVYSENKLLKKHLLSHNNPNRVSV